MLGRTNTGGGGSGGLNFKVICGTQPSTAKENTIWVDTDRINNYYFSAEQPENMTDYDVWFPIGTSSTVAFSATKKNHIMVYPLSAKQFISGTLVDKTAESYQGGKWNSWIKYLYNYGNSYTNIGGEWVSYYSNGTFKLESDHIRLASTKADSGMISIGKADMIEVDDMDTITLTAEIVSSTTGTLYVGINSTKASSLNIINDSPAVTRIDTTDKIGNTVDIPVYVSSIDGQFYVFVAGMGAFAYKILSVEYTRR